MILFRILVNDIVIVNNRNEVYYVMAEDFGNKNIESIPKKKIPIRKDFPETWIWENIKYEFASSNSWQS